MFLFAPTVPSEPRPKNTARTVSGDSMSSARSYGRLVPETSSAIPIVKRRLRPLAGELLEDGGDHRRA